jgi:hypothetical protein
LSLQRQTSIDSSLGRPFKAKQQLNSAVGQQRSFCQALGMGALLCGMASLRYEFDCEG